jgi:hypothetical protein
VDAEVRYANWWSKALFARSWENQFCERVFSRRRTPRGPRSSSAIRHESIARSVAANFASEDSLA